MTTASGEELQEVLATRSIRKRIEQVLILLKREIEISKLKTQISKRIEDRMSKQQREFFLKEQLKEIKQELGLSKGDAQTEVERFQERLAALTLTEEAGERVDEELGKLKLLDPSSPEFNVVRAYLDWLTVLPWGVYTEDSYDLKRASSILDEDHYGLTDVKDRILELISVGIIKGDLAGSIILLVGPPGVGKTSIGRSIARALGRKFYRFSLGGIRDEAEIKGHTAVLQRHQGRPRCQRHPRLRHRGGEGAPHQGDAVHHHGLQVQGARRQVVSLSRVEPEGSRFSG